MCNEPYQALGGCPELVGWEPHLVKMSAVPQAALRFNVIPINIMVADLRYTKKGGQERSGCDRQAFQGGAVSDTGEVEQWPPGLVF